MLPKVTKPKQLSLFVIHTILHCYQRGYSKQEIIEANPHINKKIIQNITSGRTYKHLYKLYNMSSRNDHVRLRNKGNSNPLLDKYITTAWWQDHPCCNQDNLDRMNHIEDIYNFIESNLPQEAA